ncbi:MAG: cobalamin-dependent protein, partial [Deltaproteobacteria bacterium]|nr:cobalamin-dependent protein [Deltaproteobacteria bacterium]
MKPRVYLADLRHNYTGVLSNDCMPLGVAYMKAVMDRDLPEVDSRLFAYPDHLWEVLQSEPADILMLSNYMWNEQLSLKFAELAKRVSPETLVVMGGPNIPIEPERQIAYFEALPQLDVYALGEGDFLARDLVKIWLEAGSTAAFRERDLPSSLHRDPDGNVLRNESRERHKEVEEIPSPWLTGVLDPFFDGKLAPLLETNRGCPFTCTFCVQGTRWYT